MKLLQISNRANLKYSVPILTISGLVLFFVLRSVVLEEVDQQLVIRAHRVHQMLDKGVVPNDPFISTDSIFKLPKDTVAFFSATVLYIQEESEQEIYRKYTHFYKVNDQYFKVEVLASRMEWEDLVWIIFWVFLATSILLVFSSLWINNKVLKRVWLPFFKNLEELRSYSPQRGEGLNLEDGEVDEFLQLNRSLEQMSARINGDYKMLKEFTENASHEIQTPLAIIISKLDQLDQLDQNPQSAGRLEALRSAANRLSKLSKDLLLLTRIENSQFITDEELSVNEIVSEQWELMKEMFEAKGINVRVNLQCELKIKGHPRLMNILISNLLTNAYRYTPSRGYFEIWLDEKRIEFTNNGDPIEGPTDRIFKRFYKGNENSESMGLGLALVKTICDNSGFKVSYSYFDDSHCFRVDFPI